MDLAAQRLTKVRSRDLYTKYDDSYCYYSYEFKYDNCFKTESTYDKSDNGYYSTFTNCDYDYQQICIQAYYSDEII